jgi:TubC N-terminal docking domain
VSPQVKVTLQQAAAAGVHVTLNGDRLVVRSATAAPPAPELIAALVERKADIVAHLRWTCAHCGQPGETPRSVHSGPPDEIRRVAIPEGIFPVHRECVDDWYAALPPYREPSEGEQP